MRRSGIRRGSRSCARSCSAGRTSATELQAKLDIPFTTLNHHLDRLVDGGLVDTRREGKFAFHTADYDELRRVTDFLWEDCCKRGEPATKNCC